ncbi:MAG: class I SAM-dependent methyltransferase [Chloroflexota bacterium]|nr:class I SAM-dependent methyltransferase [Chloroflexota bacterium]
MAVSTERWGTRVARLYFETSYRLLTGSPEGRRFLRLTAPLPGMTAHGYATGDDLDALIRAMEPEESGPLMDLGCGVGGIALEVNRRTGANVTGIDIAARAIETANDRATAIGAQSRVSFVQGTIRRPPRVGSTGAYALDSLMFVPIDADALLGIRDSLDGRGRLFSTVLGIGLAPRDPVAAVATALGMAVATSEDVTDGLLARSVWRRRVARHLLRRGRRSLRGGLAMALVFMEESLVQREVRAGRLRRWRTVVDLRTQA